MKLTEAANKNIFTSFDDFLDNWREKLKVPSNLHFRSAQDWELYKTLETKAFAQGDTFKIRDAGQKYNVGYSRVGKTQWEQYRVINVISNNVKKVREKNFGGMGYRDLLFIKGKGIYQLGGNGHYKDLEKVPDEYKAIAKENLEKSMKQSLKENYKRFFGNFTEHDAMGRKRGILKENYEDKLETFFSELVPRSGKSDTVEGEMVRAIMRAKYRFYNDGDKYDIGYGIETVSPSIDWLIDKSPIGRQIKDLMYMTYNDAKYKQSLDKAMELVVDHVESKNGQYEPNTQDSRSYKRPGKSYKDDSAYDDGDEWE